MALEVLRMLSKDGMKAGDYLAVDGSSQRRTRLGNRGAKEAKLVIKEQRMGIKEE